MECKNCELKQRQYYCENCLRTHLRDFRLQISHFTSERDEQVLKASRLLGPVSETRQRIADLTNYQERLEEISNGLTTLRRDNDKKRESLRTLRESMSNRRRTLAMAHMLPPTPPASPIPPSNASISIALSRARSGLVQELVEVFNVVEVGGRPPIGGKAGTKGEWTIGDLVLPVPGDIRRYPPDHINAVITHTIHFLGLLAFYLGIKLPFEITWSGNKFGVGQPWIGACRGTESGSWAKWFQKHPLHLSSNASSPTSPSSPQAPTQNLSESYILPAAATNPTQSFTTAFAMLLYNVTYLAHTQSVEVPLSQAGDVLSNLWGVCCSAELGRRSHQTTPLLPAPTPPTFHLDFAQLLQATTANPARKSRSSKPPSSKSGRVVRQKIVEEEEGWDLVDDVGSA